MIKATRYAGREMAECTCDECSAHLSFPAMHGTGGGHGKPRDLVPILMSEGKAIAKSQEYGWTIIKGVMRCPDCEAKRKQATRKDRTMTENVQSIRQPTKEEKRQIIGMLEVGYDTGAGRYKGSDTDKTIAEAIGGGVMPGWVAEIREDLFGPDGGNAELDSLAADVAAWVAEVNRRADLVDGALRDFNECRSQAPLFTKRIDALKAAIGPKAARA